MIFASPCPPGFQPPFPAAPSAPADRDAPRFAQRTGVAPSSTTFYFPYGSMTDMRGHGLGLTTLIDPTPLGYRDRNHGTTAFQIVDEGRGIALLNGARGMGIITGEVARHMNGPTDAEVAQSYGYLPVIKGWVTDANGCTWWNGQQPPIPPLAGAGLGASFFDNVDTARKLQMVGSISLAVLAATAVVHTVRSFFRPKWGG